MTNLFTCDICNAIFQHDTKEHWAFCPACGCEIMDNEGIEVDREEDDINGGL